MKINRETITLIKELLEGRRHYKTAFCYAGEAFKTYDILTNAKDGSLIKANNSSTFSAVALEDAGESGDIVQVMLYPIMYR